MFSFIHHAVSALRQSFCKMRQLCIRPDRLRKYPNAPRSDISLWARGFGISPQPSAAPPCQAARKSGDDSRMPSTKRPRFYVVRAYPRNGYTARPSCKIKMPHFQITAVIFQMLSAHAAAMSEVPWNPVQPGSFPNRHHPVFWYQ